MSSYFASELRGSPHIVHAAGHTFSDVSAKCLHIINLASVRELERLSGRTIDPLRFRANATLTASAWQEFMARQEIKQVGSARLQVFTRTERCDATNVDPETAARDMSMCRPSCTRHFRHSDFGVYATVKSGGDIKTGDVIAPAPE